MKNLGQMMKQAQEMQAKMAEMQEQLSATEVIGSAGGARTSDEFFDRRKLEKLEKSW